jgi:hypothetical protein
MSRTFDRTLVVYEEAGEDDRVLKFDHERRRDGDWHTLNAKVTSVYRIKNHRLQFIARAKKEIPDGEQDAREIERFLRGMDPILDRGVIEIWLGKDDEGFFARDYGGQTDAPRAVGMSVVSGSELERALGAIEEID